MGQSQVITAESWTPVSVVLGLLLLATLLSLIVWLVLRYGGRSR